MNERIKELAQEAGFKVDWQHQDVQAIKMARFEKFAALIECEARKDAEPNWKHPKIQALIASDARNKIVIDLIWQLIDNPECELTSMDMEYYSSIHEILKNRLTPLSSKQPLTHDQILSLCLSLWQRFEFPENLKVVAFTRAIEKAHGIGDSDE